MPYTVGSIRVTHCRYRQHCAFGRVVETDGTADIHTTAHIDLIVDFDTNVDIAER